MLSEDARNRLYNAMTGKALNVSAREYADRVRFAKNLRRAGYSKQSVKDAVDYMSYKNAPDKLKTAIKDTASFYAPVLATIGIGSALVSRKRKKKQKDNAEKTAFEVLDGMVLEKQASQPEPVKRERYLKDIDCEQCGYQGPPTGEGRCPTCGAICGVAPTKPTAPKDPTIRDLENMMGDVDSAYQHDQHEIWNRVYGG